MNQIEIKARGKINLALDIIGKRDNGYHEVDMIMQQVDLYDTLYLKKIDKKSINIKCNHPYVPSNDKNIIYKGILEIQKYLNIDFGVEIVVDKSIPVSAGLGGGSANVAYAMKAYNDLYKLNLSKDELQDIGANIGADVPFFFQGGCCRARGIGEILTPIKGLTKGWIVLCKPNIGVSTEKVYKALNYPLIEKHPDIEEMIISLKKQDLKQICKNLGNVLEQVTLKKHKVVLDIKNRFNKSNALGVLMSGSGPTVFGIFKDYKSGSRMEKKLKSIYNETYLIRAYNGGENG